jgi:hypothetical protein
MNIFCKHSRQTTPRRDPEGEYRRCLECGERLSWSWSDDFPIAPPKLVQPVAASVSTAFERLMPQLWRKSA